VQFFRGLKSFEYEEIAAILKYRFVPANKKVFEMGTEGDLFYILLDGFADVVKPFQSEEPLDTLVLSDGSVKRDRPLFKYFKKSAAKERVNEIAR
jgi:CRP-like cAMP-binding protein